MKNPNSIQKACPLFNQMRRGCSQRLKETRGLALFSSLSFLGRVGQRLLTRTRAAPKGSQAEEGPHPRTQSGDETGQHPREFQSQHWPKLTARGPGGGSKGKAS